MDESVFGKHVVKHSVYNNTRGVKEFYVRMLPVNSIDNYSQLAQTFFVPFTMSLQNIVSYRCNITLKQVFFKRMIGM